MLLLAIAKSIFAINNVAVLEIIYGGNIQNNISIDESRYLTDELRRQAVISLHEEEYSVLTRESIIALMPQDEAAAERLAEGGTIEIGRAIGAKYVSNGVIRKFGKNLAISVELYETMSGNLISSMVFESENLEGLLNAIRSDAKQLFRKIPPSNTAKEKPDVKAPGKPASAMRAPQWIGICLSAAGLGAGIYGFSQNSKYKSLHKDYMEAGDDFDSKWKEVENAKDRRNLGYAIGSALLASGITIYFVF